MLAITTVLVTMEVECSHSDLEPYKNLLHFDSSEIGLLQVQRVGGETVVRKTWSSELNTRVIKQNHNEYE